MSNIERVSGIATPDIYQHSISREIPIQGVRPVGDTSTAENSPITVNSESARKIFGSNTVWEQFTRDLGNNAHAFVDFAGFLKCPEISSEEKMGILAIIPTEHLDAASAVLMDIENKATIQEIETKEAQAEYRQRDFKLDWYFELAKLHAHNGNREKAREYIGLIQNFRQSYTSAKPKNYYESRFFFNDLLRQESISMLNANSHEAELRMRQAAGVLMDNFLILRRLQCGYIASTSQLLLETMNAYTSLFGKPFPTLHYALRSEIEEHFNNDPAWEQFFINPKDGIFLSSIIFKENAPELINASSISDGKKAELLRMYNDNIFNYSGEELLDNAIGKYNKGWPYYGDDFIATKALISSAKHAIVSGNTEAAMEQIDKCLELLENISNMGIATKSASYILSFLGVLNSGSSWELFRPYQAEAYSVKARASLQQYKSTENTDDLNKALILSAKALRAINGIKTAANFDFYTSGAWQIRNMYMDILSSHLDILLTSGDIEGAEKIIAEYFRDPLLGTPARREYNWFYSKALNIASYLSLNGLIDADDMPKTPFEMSSIDSLDGCLNDNYGILSNIWLKTKSIGSWKASAINLCSAIDRSEDVMDIQKRSLLLARSYAWLGNLMKWADEGKTDPAVEQQIIELAKGLAKTEEDKAVAGTREGAIMMLYKTALEQFAQVSEKRLYLQAEEASTKYQLADLAQGILEDKEASEALKAAAAKTLENDFMQEAKSELEGIINAAEIAKEPEIAANALVSYADSLASGISDLLAAGEPEKAHKEATDRFTVMVEAAAKLPKSDTLIEFCDKSGCKFYYNDAEKTLVVRGKMTPEDKAALEIIFTSEADRKAIAALSESSQHSLSVVALGKPVHDKEGSIPALLTVANALISKAFAENDNNGPITRIMVSEIADMAEAQILSKHPDPSAASEAVQAQLADIAALRLYVLMGSTGKDAKIEQEIIDDNVLVKEDGSLAIVAHNRSVEPPVKIEVAVTDEFMQQKLQLALMNMWIWNGRSNAQTAIEWSKEIKDNGKTAFFIEEADRISRLYR